MSGLKASPKILLFGRGSTLAVHVEGCIKIFQRFFESLAWIPIGKIAGDFHANSIRRLLLFSRGIGIFILWHSAFMSRGCELAGDIGR